MGRTVLQKYCETLDNQIDELVYELYGISDDERQLIEATRYLVLVKTSVMKDIDVIFSLNNRQGRSFLGDLTFENTRPEYKNITLRSLGHVPNQRQHPECPAMHVVRKEIGALERFELLVRKRLMKGGPKNIKAIIEEAQLEAERFFYILCITTNIKFFGLTCVGYEDEGSRSSLESLDPSFRMVTESFGIHIKTRADAPGLLAAKEKMKDDWDLGRLMLFFDSANVEDPVARFISLYTVMLHECATQTKEAQSLVDDAILAVDPHIAQFRKPKTKGYETLFTKLRNEISHKRPGSNMIKAHADIRMHVDRFEELVKRHMFGEMPDV